MTKRGDLDKVLEGLFAAKHSGLQPIKINAVIERGVNDDDILDLVDFSRKNGFDIRFIEYMDVGNSNGWLSDRAVPKTEILSKITSHYGLRDTGPRGASAPSDDCQVVDWTVEIGVIDPV